MSGGVFRAVQQLQRKGEGVFRCDAQKALGIVAFGFGTGLAGQVGAQLDSLERSFTRIVVVAEHLPEISDKVLEELNRQATQLIWTMNASVDNAFADFDRQRGELQRYVTREREALVEQLRTTGDELVRTTLDALPGLVGKILLYVVLALAVLIGGPFALGFWLGGVRARAKVKKAEKS